MKKRKGGLLQRMMAALLSAALVTGMAWNAVPASVLAQEPGEMQETVSGDDAKTKSVAGSRGMMMAAHIADSARAAGTHNHDNVSYTAWENTGSLPAVAGNYYLTSNVTLTETWDVPSGTTNLCLNGKTVSVSGKKEVITIEKSDVLNLYDCQGTGNITGAESGGVYVFDGTFRMYGGKISGNEDFYYGGGVMTSGTFEMYGGEISGNSSGYYGGGVYVSDGYFCMYGGEISGNSASKFGGGVVINIEKKGKVIVGGNAVISGNTAGDEVKEVSNVWLRKEQKIEIDSGKPLSDSARIGVSAETAPTKEEPFDVTGSNNNDYGSNFVSDNAAYEIVNTNNVVQLAVKVAPHVHFLTRVDAKDATCTEDGNTAYYACGGDDGCGKWFSDAEGEQEIIDKGSVAILSTGHSYEATWGYTEENGHAHNCENCNAHDAIQPHEPGAEATAITPQTCTVCGYEIAPATGNEPGAGTVTPEVKPGANAPTTNISTPIAELEDILLTEDEKQQVQNGTNIKIILEVLDAGNTVNDSDKNSIQQALNGFAVGQYLNINLYKLIEADRMDITETAKKIKIVISVPDSLKNTDSSKVRTFAVIREHGGKAEFLTDLDGSDDAITIETDRFSTYAVVYKDTANGGNEGDGNGGNNGGGNEGDNSGDTGNNGNNDNNGNGNQNNNDGNNDNNNNGNNGGNDNGSNNNNGNYQKNADKNDANLSSSKNGEPKTGDATPIELYATVAMIAGFAYLLLYFADRKRGMSEETKKELVSRLVRWAKQGRKLRKCLALAAIFVLLAYYHSIGKKTYVEWNEIYGE